LEKNYAHLYGVTKAKAKAAGGAAAKFAGDVIGPPARFLGSVMEAPVALGLKYGLGTDVPYRFSPSAGMEQFESPEGQEFLRTIAGPLPPFTPAAADIAANVAMTGPMNLLGKAALMPAARAALEPARRLPVVKEALEFTKTGASLPAKYREYVQNLLRTEEGKADWRAFLREKQFGDAVKLPQEAQERIGHAIETKTLESLSPEEQGVAQALVREYASIPKLRRAAGGRGHELSRTSRLGFIPRIERTGKQRAIEQSPGFGTNPGQARTELGRELTSREMGGDYKPAVEAALVHGQRADTRVMRLGIVKDLVERFGTPSGYSESVAKSHEGIATGFSPAMKGLLQSRKLPPELDELVGRLNKRLEPEEFGRVSRAIQWVNQGFKKWALFSPGYTSRNLQNNLFQIALFEDLGPKEAMLLKRAAFPDASLTEEAIKMGVVGRGQTAQEIARTKGTLGKPLEGARNVNTKIEDTSRLWLYLIRRSKGDEPAQAAKRVDDLLFNYSSRTGSRARREIGRKYVPFVNWSTFIPGLAARAALERPGSVGALSNLRDRQNRAMGYDDERLAEEFGPWNLPQGVVATGEGKGFVPQFAGQYSVNEMVPSGLTDALDKLLAKIYPTAGVPAGLGTGREPFSGRPFKYGDRKDRFSTAPSSLRVIFTLPGGPEFAAAHGISIDPKTKKVVAPSRVSFVLGSFPQSRLANIVADYVAGVKGKEASAKSFGLGIRTVEKYVPKSKR
jgi:hypothetical protein